MGSRFLKKQHVFSGSHFFEFPFYREKLASTTQTFYFVKVPNFTSFSKRQHQKCFCFMKIQNQKVQAFEFETQITCLSCVRFYLVQSAQRFFSFRNSTIVFSSKPETSVLSQQPATWQRSILVFCFQKPKTETHFACTFLQKPKLYSQFVLFLEIWFCNFPFLQIPILPRINCKPKFTQIPIFANSHFIENRLQSVGSKH